MITEDRANELLLTTTQRIKAGVLGNLEEGDFGGAMESLDAVRDATRWVQGDLINEAKAIYGITAAYKLASRAMGTKLRWSLELSRVSDTFPPEKRRADIPWAVYRAAAWSNDPYAVLDDAIATGKTPQEIRDAVRKARGVRVNTIEAPPSIPDGEAGEEQTAS